MVAQDVICVKHLGLIFSVASIVAVFFVIYLGRRVDRNPYSILKYGIPLKSISWLLRLFFLTPLGVFFTTLYSAVVDPFLGLPVAKSIYIDAKRAKNPATYFLFRELNLMIGRIVFIGIALLTSSLIIPFVLVFLGAFLYVPLLNQIHPHTKGKTKRNYFTKKH